MPKPESAEARLDRLLEESAALQATSAALTREVERLRAEIAKEQATERRKKPRVKGK